MDDLISFIEKVGPILQGLGVTGMAVLCVWGLVKPKNKWVVPASFYESECAAHRETRATMGAELAKWQEIAMRSVGISSRAVNTIDRALEATPPKEHQ